MKKQKKIQLDPEEQAILEAFEKGELKSISNVKKEIKRYTAIAKAAGNKAKRVSLRMTEWDFNRAQETALREGLPYQTLLSSVIHKYLAGQLIEKNKKHSH